MKDKLLYLVVGIVFILLILFLPFWLVLTLAVVAVVGIMVKKAIQNKK